MEQAEAEKIAQACFTACWSTMFERKSIPLPECTLREMLAANEMARRAGKPCVADRGLAAIYAYQQFGDIETLLSVIGYAIDID